MGGQVFTGMGGQVFTGIKDVEEVEIIIKKIELLELK